MTARDDWPLESASGLALSAFSDVVDTVGWTGVVDVDATVGGTLVAPRLRGTAALHQLSIPGQVGLVDFDATFSISDRRAETTVKMLRGGVPQPPHTSTRSLVTPAGTVNVPAASNI